jgi:alkyl sulfatase BDS1-like metallo-beta-lactamase superfamily hydrolase
MTVLVRYLSPEWIDAVQAELTATDALAEVPSDIAVGVTQVVTDTPDGDVTYHLQVGEGSAAFATGVADPEHVRFVQDWETATAVATGHLSAQEAFINGRIRLVGDQQKLLESQPVFGALDQVFNTIRARTDYS